MERVILEEMKNLDYRKATEQPIRDRTPRDVNSSKRELVLEKKQVKKEDSTFISIDEGANYNIS